MLRYKTETRPGLVVPTVYDYANRLQIEWTE